jgi:predicted branched-subunit amino acid permease
LVTEDEKGVYEMRERSTRGSPVLLNGFAEGVLGPGLGTFAAMIGFGSLAGDSGTPIWAAVALTLGAWSMPGQIAFVDLFPESVAIGVLFAVVATANVRMLPLTIATIPLLRSRPGTHAAQFLLAQLNSVTSYVRIADYAADQPDVAERLRFYTGFTTGTLVVGTAGTVVGFTLAGTLPPAGVQALVFVAPAYLLLLTLRSPKAMVLASVALGCVLVPSFAAWLGNVGIVAGGVAAGTVAWVASSWRKPDA